MPEIHSNLFNFYFFSEGNQVEVVRSGSGFNFYGV